MYENQIREKKITYAEQHPERPNELLKNTQSLMKDTASMWRLVPKLK